MKGQNPYAIILTCSDSRVAPEYIFDQGFGDMFVIRVAGNTVNDAVLGSIEYAIEHLKTSLIVVMGHEKCGAVAAAMESRIEYSHNEPSHIESLVHSILPAVEETKKSGGDLKDAIELHAKKMAMILEESQPVLQRAFKNGALHILPAYYEFSSGKVMFL